jgi:hypothetical protein
MPMKIAISVERVMNRVCRLLCQKLVRVPGDLATDSAWPVTAPRLRPHQQRTTAEGPDNFLRVFSEHAEANELAAWAPLGLFFVGARCTPPVETLAPTAAIRPISAAQNRRASRMMEFSESLFGRHPIGGLDLLCRCRNPLGWQSARLLG